ncbi:MAG TPA: VOC family protein [Hyphomicrobiaceae bacterium]|nr:VOC family protein [Hyphomicrobiaceae bacterium]
MGNVRNLDLISAASAALNGAISRARSLAYWLRAVTQVRLSLAGTAARDAGVGTPVIPTVRYRDVPAAVDWLCRAFGMQVHRVITDSKGQPRYAELTVGSGMLMVAPIEDTAFGKLMVQPDEIGGVETQVCYLCVGNTRAHHARAKAAGAVVIIEPEDEANRGRGYSCRDPEGHVWNFGTYDPWGKQPTPPATVGWGLGRTQQAMAALVMIAVVATVVMELLPQPTARAGTAVTAPEPAARMVSVQLAVTPMAAPAVGEAAAGEPAETKPAAGGLRPAEATAMPARQEAADEASEAGNTGTLEIEPAAQVPRVALVAAERIAATARSELAETRSALTKAQHEANEARVQLEEMQRAKLSAERSAAEAQARLTAVQETAERAREAALEAERDRRSRANRAVVTRKRAHRRHIRRRVLRTWCYRASEPQMVSTRGARLSGFCRG